MSEKTTMQAGDQNSDGKVNISGIDFDIREIISDHIVRNIEGKIDDSLYDNVLTDCIREISMHPWEYGRRMDSKLDKMVYDKFYDVVAKKLEEYLQTDECQQKAADVAVAVYSSALAKAQKDLMDSMVSSMLLGARTGYVTEDHVNTMIQQAIYNAFHSHH